MAGLEACSQQGKELAKVAPAAASVAAPVVEASGDLIGFDLNDYPGDEAMARMKKRFAYTGYWLTAPPGENTHTWVGKRGLLRGMGYGFLVLANGRVERQIKASKLAPGDLGIQDGTAAVAAAKAEGFPEKTIVFLDQEEGGRLTDAQTAYLFGWTEAVASTGYRPGVYASGQAVSDGPGATITTIQNIREHVAKEHLHPVAVWVYQDACAPKGPSTGCTMTPPARGGEWNAGCAGLAVRSVAQATCADAELLCDVSAGRELHGAGGALDADRHERGGVGGPFRWPVGR